MNAFKRFFALILSLCMVLSYVPVSAFAAGTEVMNPVQDGKLSLNNEEPTATVNATTGTTLDSKPANGTTGSVSEPFLASDTVSKNYRIPGLVILDDGTLIAAADARYDDEWDGGGSDMVVSRLAANATEWSYSFMAYLGDNGNYHNTTSSTMMDPLIVTDGTKLYMIYDLFPAGLSIGGGSNTTYAFNSQCADGNYATGTGFNANGKLLLSDTYHSTTCNYYLDNGLIYNTSDNSQVSGYTVDEWFNVFDASGNYVSNLFFASGSPYYAYPTSYLAMQTSTDGGVNWSDPEFVNVKHSGTYWQVVGPGSGIVTSDGNIAFTVYNSDSSISLVYGKSGNWNTVKTSAGTNESSIVELNDGTIRAFIKNNDNQIKYVDFKKTDSGYTAGAAVSTGIPNTSWCMISSMVYSRTIDNKEVILVCCPSNVSYRTYGKVFAFTRDTSITSENDLTKVGEFAIDTGYTDQFFAYSDMAELPDGTIGLLYEDGCLRYNGGTWNGGAAGITYSHISYTTVDPEDDMSLTFDEVEGTDIFVWGTDNTQGQVEVKESANVDHVHVRANTSLADLTEYVAYDVVLCTDAEADCTATFDCTNTYTGKGTVTMPITAELAAKDLKGFVVNSDGTYTYIMDVTVKTVNSVPMATFKAPHFSTAGVMAKTPEESASVIKDVTVNVGGTYTDTLTDANLTGSNADQEGADKAAVTWNGTQTSITYPTAQLGTSIAYDGTMIDLNNCLYTFTENSDGTWVISADVGGTTVYIDPYVAGAGGYPNRTYSTNVTLANGNDGAITFGDGAGYLHFWDNSTTNLYWDNCTGNSCTGHQLQIYKVGDTTNTTTILGGYFSKVTSVDDIDSGSKYLIVGHTTSGYDTNGFYAMHPANTTTSKWAHVAKITGNVTTETEMETNVTIQGVTVGTTSVLVGDVLYNITVKDSRKTVNVELAVGQNTTITDDTGNYQNNVDRTNLNESVATVAVSGTSTDHAAAMSDAITDISQFDGTKQYLLVCNRPAGIGGTIYDPENSVLTNETSNGGLYMNGPKSADSTELWTITPVNGGYTITQGDQYVTFGNTTAAMTETETVLTLAYETGTGYRTGWTIFYNNQYLSDYGGVSKDYAAGWYESGSGSDNGKDDGSYWTIYEVTPAHTTGTTEITIQGVAEGNTSVQIGDTVYNITVQLNEKDVELYVGDNEVITDDTGNYQNNVDRTNLNESVATVTVVGAGGTAYVRGDEVTSVDDLVDGTYVIVGYQNGTYLTNTASDSRLQFASYADTNDIGAAGIWTITVSNGQYYIMDADGNYLNIGSETASVGAQAAVDLVRESDHWKIKNAGGTIYLNDHGSGGTVAGGWADPNSGQLSDNQALRWRIYKVSRPASTTITINGEGVGNTSVMVGGTRYNITVKPALTEVDVTLEVGEIKTEREASGNYAGSASNVQPEGSIATMATTAGLTVKDAVTAITEGKYVIYNYKDPGVYLINQADGAGLDLSTTEQIVWNVEIADAAAGTYYITDSNGNYLTVGNQSAGVTATKTAVKLVYGTSTDGPAQSGFFIQDANGSYNLNNDGGNNNRAFGKSGANGSFSRWQFKPVDEFTDVTFTGVAVGETSAIVGNTKYNITVTPALNEVDVDVFVNDSKVFIDNTGNYVDNVTKSPDFDNFAELVVTGNSDTITLGQEVTSEADLTDGTYIIVAHCGKNLTNVQLYSRLVLSGSTDNISSSAVWTITKKTEGDSTYYYVQDSNDNYLYFTDTSGLTRQLETKLELLWVNDHWKIKEQGVRKYLNDHSNGHEYAGGWESNLTDTEIQDSTALRWRIYKVSTDSTTITIKGISAGETSAVVGNTRYNITVWDIPDPVTVDVTVQVGETKTYDIDTYGYDSVTINPENIADVTAEAKIRHHYTLGQEITANADIVVGKQYIFVNNSAGKTLTNVDAAGKLALDGTTDSIDDSAVWTVVAYNATTGVAKLQDVNGKYLTIGAATASVGTAENEVNLWDQGDYWTIREHDLGIYLNNVAGNGTAADGWQDGQAYSYDAAKWSVYEVIEDRTSNYTEVVIVGENIGTTTATVGHVTYNITVTPKIVDVHLREGETTTLTDDTGNFEASYTGDGLNTAVATVVVKGASAGASVRATAPATEIVSGRKYMIVNIRANKPVTNGTSSEDADAGSMSGLLMQGDAGNVTDDNVWTITEVSTGVYTVQDKNGKYLNIGSNSTSLSDTAVNVDLGYIVDDNSGYWNLDVGGAYLNDAAGAGTTASGWQSDAAAADAGSKWALYEVLTPTVDTTYVTITGVAEGDTSVTVGNTQYNIYVHDVEEGNIEDFQFVVGTGTITGDNGNVELNQKKVTALTLSEGTSFSLGVDIADPDAVIWEITDPNIASVDQNGIVTGLNAGDTILKVTVYKDGAAETIEIPVHITESFGTGTSMTTACWYIDTVLHTSPWYSLYSPNVTEEMMPVIEGQVIYIERPVDQAFGMVWLSAPEDGYALTFMASTSSKGQYYPLHNENNELVTGSDSTYYAGGSEPYTNLHSSDKFGVVSQTDLNDMLSEAVTNYGADGAMSMGRRANDGSPRLGTNLSFISDKLPEVTKEVYGVLGSTGKAVDWTTYTKGMYAYVDDYIYFAINITIDAPDVWEKDANGNIVTDANGNKMAALKYNIGDNDGDAMLTDVLADNRTGYYFYTKDLDAQDGDRNGDGIDNNDGYLVDEAGTLKKTEIAVTDDLNRGWTEEEIEAGQRVHQYFVLYQVKSTDVDKDIVNNVTLAYQHKSTYSSGTTNATGVADASMHVLGKSLADVVIDFGLPVTISDLNTDDLAHLFDETNTNAAVGGCKYGSVTITQTAGQDTDADTTDDRWSITYTPDTVFQGYDIVYLMSASTDDNPNGTIRSYFRVYPASTIYYEESFAEYGTSNTDGTHSWTGHDSTPTGSIEYLYVGCGDPSHNHTNFGYTDKYGNENGMSNGTQAVSPSGASGNTATFTFAGTGFDIYANTDKTTGVVSILLYKVTEETDGTTTEKLVKFYQVDTANKIGKTDATANQGEITALNIPIVSVTNLTHGTYRIEIKPSRSGGEFRMDGFRVYNTLANADGYYPAEEQSPVFTELRDELLSALTNVTKDTTVDQIYSQTQTIGNANVLYLSEDTATDLLDNGPKNEIWMGSNDTLAFTLGAGVAYAQIGLKAPTGNAAFTITVTGADNSTLGSVTYNTNDTADAAKDSVTTATDMFYRIPGAVGGATVTITVHEGLLSVTKLKTSAGYGTSVEPLAIMDEYQIASVLNVLYGTEDDVTDPDDGATTDPTDPDDGATTDPSDPDDGATTDPSDPDDGTTDPSDPDDGATDPSDPGDEETINPGRDIYDESIVRIYGDNRFETAFKVADELKAVLGVEEFDAIIVASGTNFADALSGSYLAAVKNAPILLSYNEAYNDKVRAYIADNLAEGGIVYILGGNAAVPYSMDLELIADGITVKRLAGADRFATNLAILAEAGADNKEIMVCTGTNFADSLSASATGNPILLVYNESGKLTVAQKVFLTALDSCTFSIVGGENAVSADLEKELATYGDTRRLAGENRFQTSLEIAKCCFGPDVPDTVVLAYAGNYPDGLCGGVLAYATNSPLLLTMTGYTEEAEDYVLALMCEGGVVLGGTGLISDEAVQKIFELTTDAEITVK